MGKTVIQYVIDTFFDTIDFLKTVYPFPSDTFPTGLFDFSMYHLLVAFSFISIGIDIILGRLKHDDDDD